MFSGLYRRAKAYVFGEEGEPDAPEDGQPGVPAARGKREEEAEGAARSVGTLRVLVPRQPLLQNAEEGGVQGLNWYQARLRVDRDGDVADTFYVEPPARPPKRRAGDPPGERAALKAVKQNLKAVGGSDCIVHEGNVTVVPHLDVR